MNTARIRLPVHRPLKVLPWYVNRTLEPAEERKVAAHVRECPTCQREVGELARLFSTQARAMPKRPVSEARLDDLMGRIDPFEASQRKAPVVEQRSLGERLSARLSDWLGMRPALLAGGLAALVLAVAIPTLLRDSSHGLTRTDGAYEVLSTNDAATEPLRVLVSFDDAQTPETVNQWVKSTLTGYPDAGSYDVEQRADGAYVVTFQKKPPLETVSRLLNDWRSTPNVAGVSLNAQ